VALYQVPGFNLLTFNDDNDDDDDDDDDDVIIRQKLYIYRYGDLRLSSRKQTTSLQSP